MTIQIKHRYTDAVLFECEAPVDMDRGMHLCYALELATQSGVSLRGADLSHVILSNANLSNADLSYANLRGANLSYAYLSNAYLIGAILSNADLSNADLSNDRYEYEFNKTSGDKKEW